jgi:hypothetical protein
LSATSIGVVGGVSTSGNANLSPAPTTITPVSDPFAAVPTPSLSGPVQPAVNVGGNNSTTIPPGTYKSLSVSASGILTLQPGIYVVTQAVSVSGYGEITGSGVTIYLACGSASAAQACASGEKGAVLTVSGTGIYNLVAPTSGSDAGLTIFADRNNTATVSLSGNASDTLTGSVYAKSGALALSGNGATTQLNMVVVVGTATLSGNGSITLNAAPPHPALLSDVTAANAAAAATATVLTLPAGSDQSTGAADSSLASTPDPTDLPTTAPSVDARSSSESDANPLGWMEE